MSTSACRIRALNRPAVLAAALTASLALTLSGCSEASGSAAAPDPSSSAVTGNRDGAAQRQPGVSGLIASAAGKTLQVQSATEQTAVTYTDKTTFTETKAASASALKAGMCATVRTADTSTPAATTVAASSVTLSPAVDGACTARAGGPGGGRPSGAPSGAAPSGAPSSATGFGRGTSGRVSSVDGSTFVVAATQPGASTTSDVTVTTSTSTTWAALAKASAKAATEGRCATATGTTSGTGALTASTVRLSAPSSDGTCTTITVGRGPQGGQPSQGSTANG